MKLIYACVAGAHAHQILLHRRSGKGDAVAFGAAKWTDADLGECVEAHQRLLAAPPEAIHTWLRDGGGGSQVGRDVAILSRGPGLLEENLPFHMALRFFTARAHGEPLPALGLAHLLQVNLEENRDGDLLQDTFRFLRTLGALGAPTDFGLPDDDAGLLGPARELAAQSVAAPFQTDTAAWRLSLRRVQNWAMRHRGERGVGACAERLSSAPEVAALLPALRTLPPHHILVVGFSYTMDLHWSTDAPMNSIAAAVMAQVNPGVTFGHLGHGGMSMRVARDQYLASATQAGAQTVFLVAAFATDADYEAAAEMAAALHAAGVGTVCVFDRLHPDPAWYANPDPERLRAMAPASGIEVVEIAEALRTHPSLESFPSLDGIHMRTPYHQWMAGRWLDWLARGTAGH